MPFVAFDLKGTLFTFDKVIEKIKEILGLDRQGAQKFFEYWYNVGLRDYIASSQAGKYRPLEQILEASFARTLRCYFDDQYNAIGVDLKAIMMSFDVIDPDPQALEALEMLKAEKTWVIWMLTTGGLEDTVQLLDRADLTHFVGDNILGCDDLRLSRPHPKVYSEMMRLAVHKTKRIENFYIIGSKAYDLAGAKNLSIRTVFLNTVEKVYPAEMYDTGEPDIVGGGLVECVTKLIEFERVKRHLV